MKYLVAAENDSLDARISRRFGHAPFYLLIDSDSYEFETIKGNAEHNHSKAFMPLLSREIHGVISGNIGPGVFDKLKTANQLVYPCIGLSVLEAVEKVKNGELQPLTSPTMKRSIQSNKRNHSHSDECCCEERGVGRNHKKESGCCD